MPKSAPFQAPPDTLDRLPVSVLILLKEQIIYANPAALSLLQADAPEQVLGHSVEDFLHPLDYQRVMARIRRAERTQFTNPPTEYRIYTCTRELRIIGMMSTTYMIDGQPGLLAAFMDMTERSVIEQRLRESDEQFHRMMNTMQDVFYRTDAEGITRFVCPAVKEILGYTASEIIGRPASDFYPNPQDRENLKKAILEHGFVRDFPGQMRRKDGRIIDISISSTVILDEEGKYAGVEGIWRDITERMQLERELERLATTDELTGIANRRQILQQLDHAYKRGDILLKEFIARVQQQIREIDYLGRLGGEEFLLILDETSIETAEQIGQRILQTVRQTPFDLGTGISVTITVSIGATSACHKDAKITELLEHADKALYAAKDSGRNKICWYCEQTS
ncbi:MAG: diguanylate cyclase [Halothiobacillus sp. 13-55-253]|nr:MAG: diguanylate cyclase [Halothiobacillus sp. 13-55-253]